jgi:hypothetical protein
MWTIHPVKGFLSVVAKGEDGRPSAPGPKGIVSVRFRRPQDAAAWFPNEPYVATPTGDYAGRVFVTREQAAWALALATLDLDYTNVKGAVPKTDDPLHDAMMRVWTEVGKLQKGGPYGRDSWRDSPAYNMPYVAGVPKGKKAKKGGKAKGGAVGSVDLDLYGDWFDAQKADQDAFTFGHLDVDEPEGGSVTVTGETETGETGECRFCGMFHPLTEDAVCVDCHSYLTRNGV